MPQQTEQREQSQGNVNQGTNAPGFHSLDLTAVGFSINNARICAQACADSYRNAKCGVRSAETAGTGVSALPGQTAGTGVPALPDRIITDSSTDTHVLIRDLGNALIVAFRGSASLRNWLTDFDAAKKAISEGHVHAGFQSAFDSVHTEIETAIQKAGRRVVFLTGHSLGGALAAIAGVELSADSADSRRFGSGPESTFSENLLSSAQSADGSGALFHSVYTFGQPRVGDAHFAAEASSSSSSSISSRTFRVTNGADIVPWLPGWLMGYRHFGQHIHFDALGQHNNPLPFYQLSVNGLEIWRELHRGRAALLADHAMQNYEAALN